MRKMRFTLLSAMALAVLFTLTIEALASEQGNRLDGVWNVQVTILSACGPTGVPVGGLPSIIIFTRDGKVIETPGTPLVGPPVVLRVSPGLGTWQHQQGQQYSAAFTFFRINVPANPFVGTHTITEDIEVSNHGDEFTATGTSEVLDTARNVIQSGCNILTGTRID